MNLFHKQKLITSIVALLLAVLLIYAVRNCRPTEVQPTFSREAYWKAKYETLHAKYNHQLKLKEAYQQAGAKKDSIILVKVAELAHYDSLLRAKNEQYNALKQRKNETVNRLHHVSSGDTTEIARLFAELLFTPR